MWWEPLHLDEAITLDFARRSYADIVRGVFVDRGGAPLHFFVEHATLSIPGGVEGLRLPSVVFFLASLVLAAALAFRLHGAAAAVAVPLLLATAPLAQSLATFARMYTLFVAATLASTLLALRAARRNTTRDWLLAGAATGALVYIHPIAPLYALLVAATAVLASGRPVAATLRTARVGVFAAVAVAAPYAYALAVLRSRYDVGLQSQRVRTTEGRTVIEEALHALTPGGELGALLVGALAVVGVVSLARRRPRIALALGLWLVVPLAFFTVVPASTRFFGRYLAPAEPIFFLLVAAGCLWLGSLGGRRTAPLGVALIAAVVVAGAAERLDRLDTMRGLRLREAVAAVPTDAIVFSSTGTPLSDRPPELLDDYVALERGARRVEELPGIDLRFEKDLLPRGRAAVATFLMQGGEGTGVWIFRGPERRVDRAVRRAGELVAVRVSPTLLLVRTRGSRPPTELLAAGIAARTAWTLNSPSDRWPALLLAIDGA